jgi:hypothetical protein
LLTDHLHRLEAAAALAVPLAEELRNRVVEFLVRALYRTCHPMIDRARCNSVEDWLCGFPLTPANRRYAQHRRIDIADRREHVEADRVSRADPADDQRDQRSSRQQVPYQGSGLGWLVAPDDPVVHAIAFGQLLVEVSYSPGPRSTITIAGRAVPGPAGAAPPIGAAVWPSLPTGSRSFAILFS